MKRTTHITAGAAVALPVAFGLSPAAAAGAIFLGMAGAVVPDYADLKSDARRLLKHRGFSHSLLFGVAATALVYLLLTALTEVDDSSFRLQADLVRPLLIAFALGIGSHLLLDAATPSGIRPGLPFFDIRLRILPPGMRIPTGSRRDGIIHSATSLIVLIGLCYLVFEHIR